MKKLYLSNRDKKISGLCGGIAEYFEVDAGLVRLAWILITILTGIVPGIAAYIVAVLVLPKASASNAQRKEPHDEHTNNL